MNFASLNVKHNLRVTGIIHVGAHYGEEDQMYIRAGVERRMYFEPIAANFAELERRVSGASLYRFAIGATRGTAEMYVETANQGESCSLLAPDHHLVQYPHITFEEREWVVVKRLDDFDTREFNFLVVDVQGAEADVFLGAQDTLGHIDYILTEVNKVPMYAGCALFDEISVALQCYGFYLADIEWCTETWGNAFFIKGPPSAPDFDE